VEALIRSEVRKHVGDVVATQDPNDLAAVNDAVLIGTWDPITPKQHPCLTIHVTDVRLAYDSSAPTALADHDETRRRRWERTEALREQTEAVRDLLQQRGTGLAWLLRYHPQLVIDLHSADANSSRVVALLDRIANESRPTAEDTMSEPLVNLFREFIAPLKKPAQRQLVLGILPQFFTYYNRKDLAQQAEVLADQHSATNADRTTEIA
jgi:hypothetical protein